MSEQKKEPGKRPILVVGGGISGITAAVEAAEAGYEVILVEKESYLGGRVVRFNHYFPKLCSPSCGLEINYRRIKNNPRIKVYTLAEVESVHGEEGDYEVKVNIRPSKVKRNCTACGKCAEVCPVERVDEYNYGLGKTKAIYLAHGMAYPFKYVIDNEACRGAECGQCVSACAYGAIDLGMAPQTLNLKVGAVIAATGWMPYAAEKLDNLGYGRYPNVITNVMLERLAATEGPTGGKIVRPSDGKEMKKIAFVQCAGSRDENHLKYCSSVCCMGSLKQVSYIKEQYPEAEVWVFYIDIRSMGMLEDFYRKVQGYTGVNLVKGKVAKVEEEGVSGDLIVEADDVFMGKKVRERVEMVVLATGLVPNGAAWLNGISRDEYGFIYGGGGIYGAGCARKPGDVASSVQDATGAALKAIQTIVRRGTNG